MTVCMFGEFFGRSGKWAGPALEMQTLTGDEEQLSPLQETEAPAVDSAIGLLPSCHVTLSVGPGTRQLTGFHFRRGVRGASPQATNSPRKQGSRQAGCGLLAVTDELSLEVSQSVFPGRLVTASRGGITWGCWLICRNAWVPTQICQIRPSGVESGNLHF